MTGTGEEVHKGCLSWPLWFGVPNTSEQRLPVWTGLQTPRLRTTSSPLCDFCPTTRLWRGAKQNPVQFKWFPHGEQLAGPEAVMTSGLLQPIRLKATNRFPFLQWGNQTTELRNGGEKGGITQIPNIWVTSEMGHFSAHHAWIRLLRALVQPSEGHFSKLQPALCVGFHKRAEQRKGRHLARFTQESYKLWSCAFFKMGGGNGRKRESL